MEVCMKIFLSRTVIFRNIHILQIYNKNVSLHKLTHNRMNSKIGTHYFRLTKSMWECSRNLHSSGQLFDESSENYSDDILPSDMFADQYLHPAQGHKVFIIHPVVKRPQNERGIVKPEHQLDEASGLIDALPGWITVKKECIQVRQLAISQVFTKGVFADVKTMVDQCRQKTAVFLNISMLTTPQLVALQDAWRVPVYDRYTIILQIFRLRAKTKAAKLQLCLAEIPYYRARLQGMHEGSLKVQSGGLNFIGGSGETWVELRNRLLAEKEQKIKKKISMLRKQKEMEREDRMKRDVPIVAVVGYTNAGKTSLIKALTKFKDLTPCDQLFATLDVTCYRGELDNRMHIVFIDTVGFISDIPTTLIESFSATLENVTHADVIIHVRDVSHPDTEAQKQTVMDTLFRLKLRPRLLESMIEVNNKTDLLPEKPPKGEFWHNVSCVTGDGLTDLKNSIENIIIVNTDRLQKRFLIPQAGDHLMWLRKEATVVGMMPYEPDPEFFLVDTVMTKAAYSKFCVKFRKTKHLSNI